MVRTKEQLREEVERVFGLKSILYSHNKIHLITPTTIPLVKLIIFNRGTYDQPFWAVGGVSDLPDSIFTWDDLLSI